MTEIPSFYQRFMERFGDVGDAYETLGKACKEAGPLDDKTAELVKLGIAIGSGTEGATHSHTRRALSAGATAAEIRHAVVLATTTLGFPAMMAGMSWVEDVLQGR